jgi:hypothetical protein
MRVLPHFWRHHAENYLKLPKNHPHSYDNCPFVQLDVIYRGCLNGVSGLCQAQNMFGAAERKLETNHGSARAQFERSKRSNEPAPGLALLGSIS